MPAAGRTRIIVINDNPDFLELMPEILHENAGYEVVTFMGDRTSIDDIAASKPNLVIVDLLLGGASGWEIVTLTRADHRVSQVPIIVCSADISALRDRRPELEQVGDVHLLAKPFSIDEVTTLVRNLVGRSEAATG